MMGKVIMSGIVPPLVAPISGILASDLAVGSSVYLMENGVAVEYLVVNQGKPSGSSLYDNSCDGTWFLRKDIKENRQWHSSNVNDYENSTIHAWLNRDFFNQFGAVEQAAIKQVKIPYRKGYGYGTTVTSGANGLTAKIFLLSTAEVSFNQTYDPITEGAELSYFFGCADAGTDPKRVAKLNGTAEVWWTRSPCCDSSRGATYVLDVLNNGLRGNYYCSWSYGIRPALVLPSNALFDTKTLILKGVA